MRYVMHIFVCWGHWWASWAFMRSSPRRLTWAHRMTVLIVPRKEERARERETNLHLDLNHNSGKKSLPFIKIQLPTTCCQIFYQYEAARFYFCKLPPPPLSLSIRLTPSRLFLMFKILFEYISVSLPSSMRMERPLSVEPDGVKGPCCNN